MAKPSSTSATTKRTPRTLPEGIVPTMDPAQMEVRSGLRGSGDGFDGRLDELVFIPWDWRGNAHKLNSKGNEYGWCLAVRAHYVPDEDSGETPFYDYYHADYLTNFIPANEDGPITLPDDMDELEGYDEADPDDPIQSLTGRYAYKVGKRARLDMRSQFADFLDWAAKAEGVDFETQINVPECDGLLGEKGYVYGHFQRMPRKEQPGQQRDTTKANDILVITQVLDEEGGSSGTSKSKAATTKASSAGKPKAAEADQPAGTASTGSELETQIEAKIVKALKSAAPNDDGLRQMHKTKVVGPGVSGLKGADLKEGFAIVKSDDFLSSRTDSWMYDSDEEVLTLVE